MQHRKVQPTEWAKHDDWVDWNMTEIDHAIDHMIADHCPDVEDTLD